MDQIQGEWVVSGVVVLVGVVTLVFVRWRMIKTFGPEVYRRLSIFSARKKVPANTVAEAEVYLRYGQRKKAIELLRRAHVADPANVDILAKLSSLDRG